MCEVIAGPGSGKTTVLTEHILYLIRSLRIPPAQILVLTFSRAAAVQMRSRFFMFANNSGASEDACAVTFGTFHAFFLRILQQYTPDGFRLIDGKERTALIERLTAAVYPSAPERPFPDEIEKYIDHERNRAALAKIQGQLPAREPDPRLAELRRRYEEYLRENRLLDYEDILGRSYRVLTENASVLETLRSRFTAFIIDEFQDINAKQYAILRLLSDGRRLYVVGDDDQSIYGFRGSDPSFMGRFPEEHPGCRVLHLRINYRCRARVADAAESVIRCNRLRIRKQILPALQGGCVELVPCKSEREELQTVLGRIDAIPVSQRRQTAVICRTNRQTALYRSELLRRYGAGTSAGTTAGAAGQTVLREVDRDLKAYLRLVRDYADGAVRRDDLLIILNRPVRYLPRSAAGTAERADPSALLRALPAGSPVQCALKQLFSDLQHLSGLPPRYFARYLLDSMGYRSWYAGRCGAGGSAALKALEETAAASSSEAQWRKLWEQALSDAASGKTPADHVQIMTMHGAKGLEFDTVFLPGLNDGIIPGRRCRTREETEEERRLLYVAMTRARNALILLYETGTPLNMNMPSRFLAPLGIRTDYAISK